MTENKHSFAARRNIFLTLFPGALPFALPIALAAALSLAGCAQTASLQGGQPANVGAASGSSAQASFPDIPLPAGAKMVVDKTLVVGTDNWFGQLTLETGDAPNLVFDFYRSNLPNFQWQEITSVRAPVSVLTYDRQDRILQMQIRASTLRGSEITITVSPRGVPMPSSTAPGAPSGSGSIRPAPVTRIN